MIPKIQVYSIEIANNKRTEIRLIGRDKRSDVCILILPALGVPAKTYDRLLFSLYKEDISCVVVDFQGQGASNVIASKANNFGYWDLLTQDIPATITAITDLFKKPVVILGHSLGGQLGTLYSCLNDYRLKGLILCTSGSVYFKTWRGISLIKVLAGTQFARLYARLLGYFPGKKFGFGDRTSQGLIEDWGRQALTGKYVIRNSGVDWEEKLKHVDVPVLAIHLNRDFLAPVEAVEHLCSKFRSTIPVKKCLDENLTHFSWLKHSNCFVSEIKDWLGQFELKMVSLT